MNPIFHCVYVHVDTFICTTIVSYMYLYGHVLYISMYIVCLFLFLYMYLPPSANARLNPGFTDIQAEEKEGQLMGATLFSDGDTFVVRSSST